jgi:TetR/AcrR family transcriptional repressor of mexCD-oprJ operon
MGSRSQQALQQRVASTILEAAGRVFAERDREASMGDVALEAGVARATLYRYFPNRQALLDELVDRSMTEAGARLAAARIAEVAVEEAVPRAVRALVGVGDGFVVAVREHTRGDLERFDEKIAQPLQQLCARAQEAFELRDDIPCEWLTEFLIGNVTSALGSARPVGHDDMVALISSLFFDGARSRRPRLQATV